MLFKQVHLQGIKAGSISLVFRKWRKAAVNKGSLIKTAIGLVEIEDITAIEEKQISENDAFNAGFESKDQLLKSLRNNANATLYKIQVSYHAEDPRIELRSQKLTAEIHAELADKLARLDTFSKQGNWTSKILLTIRDNPHLHAIGIARLTGFEKEWLKLNIRKLKNLGLTISHTVGYELSPLGKEFVKRLFEAE